MTIHKSQGQTLPKVVVDMGKGEKVAGCTFVVTSRVRSINDIVFEELLAETKPSKRIEEEQRLVLLSKQTLQKYSHK